MYGFFVHSSVEEELVFLSLAIVNNAATHTGVKMPSISLPSNRYSEVGSFGAAALLSFFFFFLRNFHNDYANLPPHNSVQDSFFPSSTPAFIFFFF